jgi:hypothetical protein
MSQRQSVMVKGGRWQSSFLGTQNGLKSRHSAVCAGMLVVVQRDLVSNSPQPAINTRNAKTPTLLQLAPSVPIRKFSRNPVTQTNGHLSD